MHALDWTDTKTSLQVLGVTSDGKRKTEYLPCKCVLLVKNQPLLADCLGCMPGVVKVEQVERRPLFEERERLVTLLELTFVDAKARDKFDAVKSVVLSNGKRVALDKYPCLAQSLMTRAPTLRPLPRLSRLTVCEGSAWFDGQEHKGSLPDLVKRLDPDFVYHYGLKLDGMRLGRNGTLRFGRVFVDVEEKLHKLWRPPSLALPDVLAHFAVSSLDELVVKIKLQSLVLELAALCGLPPAQVCNKGAPSRMVNQLLCSFIDFDTVYYDSPPKPCSVSGGLVLEPDAAVHERVEMFDFQAMYPRIIMEYDLCFSWLKVLPQAQRMLEERRLELLRGIEQGNADMSVTLRAVKVVRASLYGVMAMQGGMFSASWVAAEITQRGVEQLKAALEDAKALGGRVVYGNTDSLHVKFSSKDAGRQLLERINQRYKHSQVELEDVASRYVIGHNKNCYVFCTDDGKVEFCGLFRKDNTPYVNATLKQVCETFLLRSKDEALELLTRRVKQAPCPEEAHACVSKGQNLFAVMFEGVNLFLL